MSSTRSKPAPWRRLVLALLLFAAGCPSSKRPTGDMSDFRPIDHMDSDPGYRADVRKGIEATLGSALTDATAADLAGEWDRSYPRAPSQPARRYEYLADGTFHSPDDSQESPPGKWKLQEGVYTEITWGKPIPEYGIYEGTWNPEDYHCAKTGTGAIAIWNGDGSLLILLTRPRQ